MSIDLGLLPNSVNPSAGGASLVEAGQKTAIAPNGLSKLPQGQSEEFLNLLQSIEGQAPGLANPNDPRKALRDRVDKNLINKQQNSKEINKLLQDLAGAGKNLKTQVQGQAVVDPKLMAVQSSEKKIVGKELPIAKGASIKPGQGGTEKSTVNKNISSILGRGKVPTEKTVLPEQTKNVHKSIFDKKLPKVTTAVTARVPNKSAVKQFQNEGIKLNNSLISKSFARPEMASKTSEQIVGNIAKPSEILGGRSTEEVQSNNLISENNQFSIAPQEGLAQAELNSVGSAKATFNMNEVKGTENSQEIINKISDYITQTSVGKEQSLDMIVGHEDLGRFRLKVSQDGAKDQIQLKIVANNQDAVQFFKENESALIQKLNQSGFQVADIKVAQSTESSFLKNEMGSESNRNFESNNGQSAYNKRDGGSNNRDSERRREIWEMYKEKMGA